MTHVVTYLLAQSYLDATFIETGKSSQWFQTIPVDATLLSPAARRGLVIMAAHRHLTTNTPDEFGSNSSHYPYLPDASSMRIAPGNPNDAPYIKATAVVADHFLDLDDLNRALEAIGPMYMALEPERAALATRKAAAQQQRELAEKAEREARRSADEERSADEYNRTRELLTEKMQWIAEHGSAHLKRVAAAGYDCQRRYVEERTASEFNDIAGVDVVRIDWEDDARWKSRTCPSEKALDLADRVNGTVVWLTRDIPSYDEDENVVMAEEFEECEVVILERWLGKYTVVFYI